MVNGWGWRGWVGSKAREEGGKAGQIFLKGFVGGPYLTTKIIIYASILQYSYLFDTIKNFDKPNHYLTTALQTRARLKSNASTSLLSSGGQAGTELCGRS